MDVLKAIYQRRSVRRFSEKAVSPVVVRELLRAAVQAPSALNQQPWAFAVFNGRERLHDYSERAKAHLLTTGDTSFALDSRADRYASGQFNIFHDAATLILVCAKPARFDPQADCLLATQNLMLAAHGCGLGSCPVGFARPWFALPEVKSELEIPEQYVPVMPIVIGYPAELAPDVLRKEPEVCAWKWDG